MNAYITALSSWLPGKAVSNDMLDTYLGQVNRISAKTRQIILANNGIQTRYYAIDPQTGETTHNNAQMAAAAIRLLFANKTVTSDAIECLCCGTSSPDQIMPGHGSMVHGELGHGPCEVVSTAGICLTGVTALKYGAMSVAAGLTTNAVASGSELASSFLRNDFFQAMSGRPSRTESSNTHGAFSFEAEFLRWMLSDGAGAALVEAQPATVGNSLKINWIEIISHAHQLEPCMYAGAVKQDDGSLIGWREFARKGPLEKSGILTIKQDARLLNSEIIRTMVGKSLPAIQKKHTLTPEKVDWFLPHYSSQYFRDPLKKELENINFPLAQKRWFTNLATKGNTGSASFYIMLEELFSSGRLNKGDTILGMIPESGRFSVGWISLTVV